MSFVSQASAFHSNSAPSGGGAVVLSLNRVGVEKSPAIFDGVETRLLNFIGSSTDPSGWGGAASTACPGTGQLRLGWDGGSDEGLECVMVGFDHFGFAGDFEKPGEVAFP